MLQSASAFVVPLQTDVTGGGLLALVVTFLLTTLFYAVTLHLAATFFIGDVPSQRAVYAAVPPAIVSILLQQYGQTDAGIGLDPSLLVGLVVVATLLADLIAISFVYRLKFRSAAPLVLLHFGIAAVLGIAIGNILGVL
ncbi:hypothetical protein N0B31_13405 [Salinirubellus salinus]|uniref:Uncharacterized protein n=1 Tax=Salinirubellus salinus TaxID=1364945 RepID=A0A9E7R967_9EURY|nr:hypothetical protein [Salinirubellus salinus]UWM56875.1 hypothetical protein N0B31_13405 [Salinirubellus salinus]